MHIYILRLIMLQTTFSRFNIKCSVCSRAFSLVCCFIDNNLFGVSNLIFCWKLYFFRCQCPFEFTKLNLKCTYDIIQPTIIFYYTDTLNIEHACCYKRYKTARSMFNFFYQQKLGRHVQ